MPSYTYQSRLAAAHYGDRGSRKARLPEYDARRGLGKEASVYSTRSNPIMIVREVGACDCCGNEHDLINGYCDVCRACGANERQCEHAEEITL
jgi:hypothetical protein